MMQCLVCPAGDMPIALMFDGPSLGGFVCPATITSSDLWKMGQLRAGDGVQFKQTTLGEPDSTNVNLNDICYVKTITGLVCHLVVLDFHCRTDVYECKTHSCVPRSFAALHLLYGSQCSMCNVAFCWWRSRETSTAAHVSVCCPLHWSDPQLVVCLVSTAPLQPPCLPHPYPRVCSPAAPSQPLCLHSQCHTPIPLSAIPLLL